MKQNNQKLNSKKADSIPQIPILAKWEEILRGRRSGVVALIITLSVLVRGIYFYQASQTPIIFQFDKWDQTDMYFFDLWAKKIVNGDWLTNESLHPNNIWEKEIAHEYFQKNPDKYAYYLQKANGDTSSVFLSQLLWNHWFQEKTYHQEPLYAYCIALTYKIFGTNVRWVFLWQMLLGIAINILVFKITTHYFGSLSGLIAGLLSTFCGPLLVYDLVLIRSTMTVFFTLQLLWSLEKWLVDSRRRTAIIFGVVMGLAYLNQSYLMLFFGASLVLIFFKMTVEAVGFWQQFKFRIQKPAWAILGFSLMLLPLILRNVAVGVSPFSVAGTGAIVFATANEKTVEPTQIFVVDAPLTAAIFSKTDAKMLPTAIETIKSHDNFLGFLGLVAGKFFAIFHWVEIHNNINFYFYRQCAPILKWLGVTNFVIAPLSILGFILSWRRFGTKMLPMTAAVLVAMFPMLFGMVFGRFRVGYCKNDN